MELSNKTKEEILELIQVDENCENPGLAEKVFENLELYSKDEKRVLWAVWAGRIDRITKKINDLKDNKAEKEMEITKLGMSIRAESSRKQELLRQAKRIDDSKYSVPGGK